MRSMMPLRRRRIAIDVRYLSHGLVGGVHTYQRNLVQALLAADSGHDYVLWADSKAQFEIDDLPAHAELRLLPWSGAISSLHNDRQLGVAMVRSGADVAHFPANYGFAPPLLPSVVTLHDAINIMPLHEIWRGHRKRPKTLAMMTYLHLTTTQALRHQPFVVTVSKHARREILRYTKLNPARILAIPSAHDPVFQRLMQSEIDEERRQRRLSKRVVLADAIKNPASTLRAWRALPEHVRGETDLVFFSRRTPESAVLDAAGHGEVRLELRPDRADLVRLFNLADAFVFPSWYEGFGLPVLEAMACGAPVIASNRGSLPEVVGNGGTVVDAEDHEAIVSALIPLLTNQQHQERMRTRALSRAAAFSWDRTAQKMIDVYDHLLDSRRPQREWQPGQVAAD